MKRVGFCDASGNTDHYEAKTWTVESGWYKYTGDEKQKPMIKKLKDNLYQC